MRQFRMRKPYHVENNQRVVKFLFEEMYRQRMTQADMCDRGGFAQDTMKHWRLYTMPRVSDLNDALSILGYELTIRRIKCQSDE